MKVGTDGVLLGAWVDVTGVKRILDIGTGTGLIAVMLAQRSKAIIDAIEPEIDSYNQASENIEECPWKDQIHLFNIRLQDFQTDNTDKRSVEEYYDLIVTNPPYFINSRKNPDDKRRVSRHTDNLSREELLAGIRLLLNKRGRFCVILPALEAELFIDIARKQNMFCTRKLKIKPVPEKDIKRVLMQFEWKEKPLDENLVVIETGGRHGYSDEYRELTKEFYLEF